MLEGYGTVKTYRAGELVFREGEKGDAIYVILSGKVDIFRSKKDVETRLATLGDADFFGEMALFTDDSRSASAKATEETQLRMVDKETFRDIVRDPTVWTLLSTMSERIRDVDEKLERLSVEDHLRKEHLSSLSNFSRCFV
jgi:CRP-like cAMP-binding protein